MTDDQWLSDLFDKNYALLYRVGRAILGYSNTWESMIEEQIQEAFVRAWQKRASLTKHPNPDGWLVECFRKCLANACRKQYREMKHRVFTDRLPESPCEPAEEAFDPDVYVRLREQTELLNSLLGIEDARLFVRYCVNGEKASVLASELSISEQAFRMRLYRLKKKVLKNRKLFTCLVILCLSSLK